LSIIQGSRCATSCTEIYYSSQGLDKITIVFISSTGSEKILREIKTQSSNGDGNKKPNTMAYNANINLFTRKGASGCAEFILNSMLEWYFVTHHYITHTAQNTHFHEHIIRISVTRHKEANCSYVDQTNVDFNETSCTTLSKVGTRSMDGRISGHSGRVTVMFSTDHEWR
jgi:hypothetical protein